VFHFNKKHLEDETVPMWVIKSHGVTFYVDHVSAEISWSTKETPDNTHTKGSIKFKDCKLSIDDDNCATVSKLSLTDRLTLKHPSLPVTRIIAPRGGKFNMALTNQEFKHSKIKYIIGSCSSGYIICDLLVPAEVTFATLKYSTEFRILKPNENYYKEYDISTESIHIDYDDPDTPYEYS